MSTPYNLTIQMDQASIQVLQMSGYYLYAFKAVQGPSSGVPLVWFQTHQLLPNTTISWEDQYQAYASTTPIQSGATIVVSNSYPVNLGDKFTITHAEGNGSVSSNGSSPLGVDIANTSNSQFTAGLSQLNSSGQFSPMSAFPIYSQMGDLIVPLEQVLVMFAHSQNMGTVIMRSFSEALMVDFASTNARTVIYNSNSGWQTNGQTGMTIYPANSELQSLLIQP